jgi:hypothetical protein
MVLRTPSTIDLILINSKINLIMNFAKTVAKELQARNKDTSEVRDVLTG